jgi:uncharacterized protein DUF6948
MIGKYVVVRTTSAGVHVGVLANMDGRVVRLLNARRIWYWVGAFTLSELSQNGVKEGSKISIVIPELVLTEGIEIIPMSELAEKSVKGYKAYEN